MVSVCVDVLMATLILKHFSIIILFCLKAKATADGMEEASMSWWCPVKTSRWGFFYKNHLFFGVSGGRKSTLTSINRKPSHCNFNFFFIFEIMLVWWKVILSAFSRRTRVPCAMFLAAAMKRLSAWKMVLSIWFRAAILFIYFFRWQILGLQVHALTSTS